MAGRGALEELPDGFPEHPERLMMFSNAWEWVPAKEPVDNSAGQVDTVSKDPIEGLVGPGVAFADTLADALPPYITIALVPCALGDTYASQWLPDVTQPPRTTLYGSCVARALEASREGELAGLLWYQGESDALNSADATMWGSRTQQIFDAFRSDLGSDLPIVYAQLASLTPSRASTWLYWDAVKIQQALLQRRGQVMIETIDVQLNADGLHVSTAGHLILGPRFARAWLGISREAP